MSVAVIEAHPHAARASSHEAQVISKREMALSAVAVAAMYEPAGEITIGSCGDDRRLRK
jgi:hypothetical protein